jgi:signal peptidase I
MLTKESACFKFPAPILNELWEELLIQHKICWARVISNSMYPLIQRDDQVLVERANLHKVHFGDIAVFRRNGTLMTHRVLRKHKFNGEYHFLEKGDATLQSGLVSAKNIIGWVIAIKSPGKTILTMSGSGRWLQLALACISYASLQLWVLLKYCMTLGRCITNQPRGGAAFNRFLSLFYRITLWFFSIKSRNLVKG